MSALAIPCLVLAGVNGCMAAFYLLFYLRRREPKEHLPFALLCFSLTAYDVFCAGLYSSESLADGIFWQRLQLLALSPVSVFTIWFLGLITERRLNRVLRSLIAAFCVLVFVALAFDRPGLTLSLTTPAIKPIRWGDRGYWNQIEVYIARHSDATFTHGICPECMRRLYPQYADRLARERPRD